MVSKTLTLLAFAGIGYASQTACKCTPEDSCWPSVDTWNALNKTVSGKLIHNLPVAISCYPGPYQNAQECADVYSQWSNSTWQELSPVGYMYPTDVSCPAVDLSSGQTPGTCTLGPAPVYTINATEPAQLAAGVAFAQKNNVRLVVRNTGHDMLGKSEGYGALQIWIKYIQKGIDFHETYTPSDKCASNDWKGSAMTIGGGYVWEDAYNVAFKRNVVIVGGGDPTVGCIGGYTQGGGHSPASRDYGLAADQVLEAQVVLASGSIVTANACQNSDLYFAIRGGGGGSYGVVTSMTVKVYPSKPVVAQSLMISPIKSDDINPLLEAVTDVHAQYPDIMDGGFSGYGSWSVNSPMKLFGDENVGYTHAVAIMGKSMADAQEIFEPLLKTLQKYNGTSLSVSVSWFEFPSYAAYYKAMSGMKQPVGGANSALTSRMMGKTALTSSRTRLRSMIGVIGGKPAEYTINNVELVGGGKVLTDGSDKYSAVNPAWRSTYIVSVVARGWADESTAQAVKNDVTYNKGGAMSVLTPTLGSYLNEADRNDPLWAVNFYGVNYLRLALIKKKYDPTGLFYCPTCVGSPSWYQRNLPDTRYGPLCATGL
ncbi:FAD-binding, type 2 [Penicillium griseofulvum]|uniref:FAD-binding, type 2 n=1 Tax=Penicillium patulum TaxID=5078 RepID=A0A135LE40_PENPA|nr:FAD-binding, type 2 [Penicillium griseofulvum]KXG47233.1 FAD-binding, type 2 [Penicillium griseofulvum]